MASVTFRFWAILFIGLDEYERNPKPDFVKCDVEGAEGRVFSGAHRLLQEKRPGIVCELHGPESRPRLSEVFAPVGYVSRPLGDHHVLALLS